MKQFCTLILILFLFADVNSQIWQALPNAPGSWRFDDMYFLNPQKGWAIHPYYNYLVPHQFGEVFSTDNGGQTWQKISDSSKTFIRCVGFTDNLNGWFGNLADTETVNGIPVSTDTIPFYHTKDGGFHWSPVTNIPDPKPKGICGISIVTDSVIYGYGRFFGPAVLIKSLDKGNTWTSQDMSAYATGLVDGYFFNKDTGFVTGAYGNPQKALILSTFDGGRTWQIRYQPTRVNEIVWKIVFPSRNVGYASVQYLGNTAPYNTYIAKTTDGGLTWSDKPFISSYDMQGIGFINDTLGWVGGAFDDPKNYKTIDGGNTWTVDPTFGVKKPPYTAYAGTSMNRFRRFGDTLMYASGNTIYKFQSTGLGIHSISTRSSVTIFPNPLSTTATVEIKNGGLNLRNTQCTLFNIYGAQIMNWKPEAESSKFDRDHIASGIYFLRVENEYERVTKKIVIE